MPPRLSCALALVFLAWLSPTAAADGGARIVTILRRPGNTVYEQVIEEFRDRCRLQTRILSLDDRNSPNIRQALRRDDVVFAVGQQAVDAIIGTPARVVTALALTVPLQMVRADPSPPGLTTTALSVLKQLKPEVRTVGAVHGPETTPLVRHVQAEATRLGLEIVSVLADDGPAAIRALGRLAPHIDALWLVPDLRLLTPQVFRAALMLELRRSLPIVAVTRQQVQSGALLAYDTDPSHVALVAADLVHQLSDGVSPEKLLAETGQNNVELTVNGNVAQRLHINPALLKALNARVEQR